MLKRLGNRDWLLPFILALCLCLVATTLHAQDNEADPPSVVVDGEPMPSADVADAPKSESSRESIGNLPFEVLPKLFYLKDNDGRLRAVPGAWTLEQFMEVWKREHRIAQENQRPPYTIERLELSGTADKDSAELIARFKIILHQDGWINVPLLLNRAVLRDMPAYEGPGRQVLHVDPDDNGHVVWIEGKADEAHTITLKLLVPVEQVGPQSRMRLNVPRATVAELQLQVPLGKADAEVSEGSTLDTVRAIAGGKTELRVLGLGGDFELSWHPANSNVASVPTILEVSSSQLIRLNGRSANTDIKLTVRSLGSEFDHFQVRLPPGADYVGTPEAGVSLVAIDATATEGKLYDVRLERKTIGPVEIRLVTERAHDATQDDSELELAGFEVPGAVRQWGTITVQIEGNWQVLWGNSEHVRAVDDVETTIPRDEIAAGFEYFVQPYSLLARVVPQQTRIRVEPTYVLLVGDEDVRLQANLKYRIRGAKVRTLTIDLPSWEIDSVEPPTLVNADTAIAGVDGTWSIPLLQATSGDIELSFQARQRLAANIDEVRLDLPHPHGDVAAADVAIVADDQIELLPRLEELRHLAPQATRPSVKLPKRQQEPLFYRTTGEAARFVADLKVHEQEISSSLATTLRVNETETAIEQNLQFNIAYRPTDHVTLVVPTSIRPERLTINYGDEELVPTPLRDRVAPDAAGVPVQIELPTPVIGRCEVRVSYTRRHEKPPTQASLLVTVPLLVPGEGTLVDSELHVIAGRDITVAYPQGPWTPEGSSTTAGTATSQDEPQDLVLTASRAIPELTLAISSKQGSTESTIDIQRVVMETLLTDQVRQDRAILRLSTDQSEIEVSLPEGTDTRSLALAVDGLAVAPESVLKRVVTIPLTKNRRDHVVDLRYHFSSRPARGTLRLDGPRVVSAPWIQQVYWAVTVPASEHVLFGPPNYTEELAWQWKDFFWEREPTVVPADLYRWVSLSNSGDSLASGLAASNDNSAVKFAANGYLYSTVGGIRPLEVYTMSRARLVLVASLPLLVAGLVLIYFPVSRHPALLLAFAAVVVGSGIVAPHIAVLLAQAAVLGLVLLVLSTLLSYLLPRTPKTPSQPSHGSSYAVVERSVTELYHRSPSGGSHPASTATKPLVPASPEGES